MSTTQQATPAQGANLGLKDVATEGAEMKIYRSADYPMHWFAFSIKEQWVRFPAESGGWKRRQPMLSVSIKELNVRQIPLWLGFNTGIPGAPQLSKEGVILLVAEAA